jgi:DNA-binding transcriptional ArsR family regulator
MIKKFMKHHDSTRKMMVPMRQPNEFPNIARIGALVGNPARALIISALMDGSERPAGELAAICGATPQATSAHLASLVNGGLLAVRPRGRHRYYVLRDERIAAAIETLSVAADLTREVAAENRAAATRHVAPALKHARRCYDHIAGTVGVAICDALIAHERIIAGGEGLTISAKGRDWLAQTGLIPPHDLRRALIRPCLDWTERRPHLAGWIGAALYENLEGRSAFRSSPGTRALSITPRGYRLLRDEFGLAWPK